MKPAVSALLGLGLVALLGHAAAGSGGAQVEQQATPQAILNAVSNVQTTVGNIPPAWSQLLPVAERFVAALGGAAVLDKETGLVWELAPRSAEPGTDGQNWFSAHRFCNDRSVGGRKGWRLPALQELMSLVDPTQTEPALPVGHPFRNVQPLFYWSATTDVVRSNEAKGVIFSDGRPWVFEKSDSSLLFAWCVRGGHGGPEAQ